MVAGWHDAADAVATLGDGQTALRMKTRVAASPSAVKVTGAAWSRVKRYQSVSRMALPEADR
jgi:hypothetical protein